MKTPTQPTPVERIDNYRGWLITIAQNSETEDSCGASGGTPGWFHATIDNYELHEAEGMRSEVHTYWDYRTVEAALKDCRQVIDRRTNAFYRKRDRFEIED